MKKFLSSGLVFIMILVSVPVMAQEFKQEEVFAFDIYDLFEKKSSDEAVLMGVDEAAKAELEKRLIAAWENMDSEVQLYPDVKIHKDDILNLYVSVFFENPKYYYVVRSFSYTSNSSGYLGKVNKMRYNVTDKSEIEKTWVEISRATEEMLLYISPDMTDFEKVMTVHDYMVNNYIYDINDADQTYLIMLDKKGVCAAYSEAFQHMMNELGIEATLVRSEAMAHIWNMVKHDNFWYHIDVTWDDPVPDQFARVNHQHMLLSENAITDLGHDGFTAPYYAGKTTYNNAPWRDEEGAIVTIDGIMYYVDENNLIDENGNIIYKNLDGGDGKWSIGGGYVFRDVTYAGLCQINGVLYFNTDKAIYSYDPENKSIDTVLEKEGVCGLYADKNILLYNEYDRESGAFVKAGEIRIADMELAKPYYEDGKAVVRLYNDYDVPVWIISAGDGCKVEKVEPQSMGTAKFDNGEKQTIYIWKNNLEPIVETVTISE